MKIGEWVAMLSRRGDVCTPYMRKLAMVETREDVFRILCDVNGGSWLFGLHVKGMPMPVDDFCEEYRNFLNGGRVVSYPQGYTSKMYCRHGGEVVADTTLVYFLECAGVQVTVPANAYPSVILSRGSRASIAMMPGARLNIETYGDAEYSVSGDMTRVRITKH